MKHRISRRAFLRGCTLLAASAAVGSLTSCGGTNAKDSDLPQIIVGSDTYPPYIYLNNDGIPAGIDVEIATEAFRRMGYAARFEPIDWEQKTNLVESGTIDCIWGCFSMDGREEVYRWAGPYMVSRQVVAVDADSSIRTLGDLAGKTIAVQSTGKPEEIFLSGSDPRIPQTVEVFSIEDRSVQYAMLACGYVDAIAAHETGHPAIHEGQFRGVPHPRRTAAGHRAGHRLCQKRQPRAGQPAERCLLRRCAQTAHWSRSLASILNMLRSIWRWTPLARKNRNTSGYMEMGLYLIIGVLFMVGIVFFSSWRALRATEARFCQTLDFVKSQSTSFEKHNDTDRGQSAPPHGGIGASAGTGPCARPFRPAVPEQAGRAALAHRHFGSGPDGTLLCESTTNGIGYARFGEQLKNDAVLDVFSYPQKTYLKRVLLEDGSAVDVAAHRAESKECILLAYRYTPAEFVEGTALSIQSVLDGYSAETSGTLFIVQNNQVIASNRPELIGQDAADSPLVQGIRKAGTAETLTHTHDWNGSGCYFGMYCHGRSLISMRIRMKNRSSVNRFR